LSFLHAFHICVTESQETVDYMYTLLGQGFL